MRIAFVIDRLILGGAENVFIDLVDRFYNEFKFDIVTITHFDDNEIDYFSKELANDLRIFSIKRKTRLSLKAAVKLNKTLNNYNIVHVHLRHTYRYVAWVRKLFYGKYKIVLHDHEGKVYIDSTLPSIDYFLIKPDYYIGVCERLRLWATESWGIDRSSVLVLLNLPKFSDFTLTNLPKKVVFISIGNIKPNKNQLFLAKLASEMNSKLCIYGNNQDSSYYKSLLENSNVNIISGENITIREISQYHFGLFASKYESGPLVLLEYVLAEIPFLAYQVGGMADAIAEFFPEYFIDNFDKAEWKLRILKLLEVPFNVELHRQKVNEMIIKYFSAENYKNELYKIYNGLMKC